VQHVAHASLKFYENDLDQQTVHKGLYNNINKWTIISASTVIMM